MDHRRVLRADVRQGQIPNVAVQRTACQRSCAPRFLVGALLVAAAACGVAGKARAVDAAFAPDKLTHFSFGVPSGVGATLVVDQFAPRYRLVGGALLGTAPGLLVEILDSTGHAGFSAGDLLADFTGAALGALLTDQIILRFWFDGKGPGKGAGVEVGGRF